MPAEPFFDYLLLPYIPLRPAEGKLKPSDLLLESFALMGVAEEGRRVTEALAGELGPGRTVWGIKHGREEKGLSWEIYVYRRDGGRGEPMLDGVLRALRPHLEMPARPKLPHRWELFSFELDPEGLRAGRAGELDVYVGMRAYRADGEGLELKNYYTFDDPGLRLDRVLERLLAAVHAPRDGEEVDLLLPPRLLEGCPRVCVANKRRADGLYFSHLRLEQLLWFFETHAWPAGVRGWVERNAGRLDHLLWDAGYDFRRDGSGLRFLRSGFYGFL